MNNSWKIYALLSAAFAGATAILAKIGIQGVNSNLATAIRTVVIVVFAWGIVMSRGEAEGLRRLSPTSLTFLILSGLATGASWLCYFKALSLGPASRVAPIDKLSFVVTVAGGLILFREKISWTFAVGILLIAGGVLMTLIPDAAATPGGGGR